MPRLSPAQKSQLVTAYKRGVEALVPAGFLAVAQAAPLSQLADAL